MKALVVAVGVLFVAAGALAADTVGLSMAGTRTQFSNAEPIELAPVSYTHLTLPTTPYV